MDAKEDSPVERLIAASKPSIAYFQNLYKKYSNFGKQLTEVGFDNDVGFGQTSSVIIPKFADFIHKMYLVVTLPQVVLQRSLNASALQTALTNLTAAQSNVTTLQQYSGIIIRACLIIQAELELITINLQSINNTINHYFIAVIDTNQYLSLQSAISALNPDILQNSDIKAFINSTTSDSSLTSAQKISLITSKIASIQFYLRGVLAFYQGEYRELLELYNELNNEHYNFAWVPFIGHYLVNVVEISIGKQRMDLHSADWLQINYELSTSPFVRELYDSLIGNTALLTGYNRNTKPETTLILPLSFWFCKYNGSMIPTVALPYHDITLTVSWAEAASCYLTDAPAADLADLEISASLYVEYFYVDTVERAQFAQLPHEYLIEQVQYNRFDGLTTPLIDLPLDFNHCSKQIFWFVRLSDNALNRHNFSFEGGPTIASAFLQLEKYKRMDEEKAEYYNYVQPYEMAMETPQEGLYSYSFCLYPTQFQPSGQLNFSKLKSAKLILQLAPALSSHLEGNPSLTLSIHVYSASYNILGVFGGKAGLIHSF